jgi:hypothetical protein
MGRYISTGTAQATACTSYSPTTCYQVSNYKYSYDSNECWQNRIMLDKPGSYTFVVPVTTTGSSTACVRAIAVGGGGKACVSDFYCNFAGSGGGYAESVHTVTAGCVMTVVVGRQQQDTTIAYTCAGGVAQTLTGSGAANRTPGAASGGNVMNSRGGCGGWGRNYQEVRSTCPSTCLCIYPVTCCGYCVVYGCNCISFVGNAYCVAYFPGGGSAGSFVYPCGGNGGTVCHKQATYGGEEGGSMAGGGGGIGYLNKCCHISSRCDCICRMYGNSSQPGVCSITISGGGGGSRFVPKMSSCEQTLWTGLCEGGIWRTGAGGRGGCDNHEGIPDTMYWTCALCMCTGRSEHDVCCGTAPKKWPWHDVFSISGTGASGKGLGWCADGQMDQGQYWVQGCSWGGRPEDAGEGAGTGGAVYPNLCDPIQVGWPCSPGWFLDWQTVCNMGLQGSAPNAYDHVRGIAPGIISQAGIFGGSGGIGVHGFASKAGLGGGAGMFKCYIICICHGGSYDCCNGVASTPLAFPPCILDNIVSNAGSGVAIIYWKD